MVAVMTVCVVCRFFGQFFVCVKWWKRTMRALGGCARGRRVLGFVVGSVDVGSDPLEVYLNGGNADRGKVMEFLCKVEGYSCVSSDVNEDFFIRNDLSVRLVWGSEYYSRRWSHLEVLCTAEVLQFDYYGLTVSSKVSYYVADPLEEVSAVERKYRDDIRVMELDGYTFGGVMLTAEELDVVVHGGCQSGCMCDAS